MKKSLLWIVFASLLATGCLNMDDLLFNPRTVDAYELNDSFREGWEFTRTDAYRLADSMVHLVSYPSQLPGESAPETIYGVYIGDTARIGTDTVIVYCHGTGGSLDSYWDRHVLLANAASRHQFGFFAMDYRGYGMSSGSPSEDGLYADVDAGLGWLADRGLTGDRTVLYGFSLGSAPATELTSKPRTLTPGWLILEAPFASAEMIAQGSTNLNLDGDFFTTLEIDNAEEIKRVEQPFLWIHGTADDYLDYETHGETVWANYQGSRGVDVRVQGADHGDVPYVYGLEAYMEVMADFIQGK